MKPHTPLHVGQWVKAPAHHQAAGHDGMVIGIRTDGTVRVQWFFHRGEGIPPPPAAVTALRSGLPAVGPADQALHIADATQDNEQPTFIF